MKKLIVSIFVFASFISSAQDTTTVEQYCRIIIAESSSTTKVRIEVDMGEQRKLSVADIRLRDDLTSKLKRFNSVVDALNYMGLQGWSLLNAFPMGEFSVYHYYFRKRFLRTELD